MGLRRAVVVAGCALMGGCSLFDPYVDVDPVHVAGRPGGPISAAPSEWESSQNLLKLEHDSAQAQADSYRWAVKTPTRLKSGMAVGLPFLGGAVAVAGATHDRSDFPLIGGVVGATALGVTGLLTSPTRSAIYLQAQTATLCAMSAYDVYFISQASYTTYLSDDTALSRDIVAVTQAQAEVKTALDIYMNDAWADADAVDQAAKARAAAAQKKAKKKKKASTPATSSAAGNTPPAKTVGEAIKEAANGVQTVANGLLSRAESDLTAAEATRNGLMGVRGRTDEAGRSLGARRMAIKAEVDQSLQTTELTVDQIKAAVSAAALASNQPTAAPPAASDAKTTDTAAAQAGENPSVRGEFAPNGRAGNLWRKMQALEAALKQQQIDKIAPDNWLMRELQKERDATQAAACAAAARAVLTATPPNPAQVAKGKSLNIPIHAPTFGGAPSASKLGDGLTAVMTATGPYDYTLVISESGASPPTAKAQTVVVTSGAQSVNIPFTVTDAAEASGNGGGGTSAGGTSGGDAAPPPPPPSNKSAP